MGMTAVWVWFGVAASYMVLAGQFSFDEIVAGALLGCVGAAWHAAVRRAAARSFAFDRHAAVEIGRAFLGLPGATLRVGVRLAASVFSPVEGRRVEHVFQGGRQDAPEEAGRRAVVVLATSLVPDSYVLRVALHEGTVLFHAITDRVPSRDPKWPS